MVSTALRAPAPCRKFFSTGVIGRAGLDQGRGVLSRVTSASMLLFKILFATWQTQGGRG